MALPVLCYGQDEDINDSLQIKTEKPTMQARSDTVLKRVERWTRRDKFLPKLIRNIVVFENRPAAPTPEPQPKKSNEQFIPQQKKIIRRVDIQVLDPFGPTIHDPYHRHKNWLEKSGNSLHYRTRQWIIRNKLLFKQGDSLDAFKLSESERLVRSSSYITDAKIIVQPYDIDRSGDSVDVLVMVQDLWAITPSFSVDVLEQNSDASITDENFLGLGHRIQNKIWFDKDYKNGWKYNGQYFVPEIAKTYISGRLYYNTENFNEQYGLEFNRPFFSSTTRWAGGYNIRWAKDNYSIPIDNETSPLTGKSLYNNHDIWVGHAFKPVDRTWAKRRPTQTIVSARTMITEFLSRPEVPGKDLRPSYLNRTTYLASIGFSYRDYYKDNYIFGFGRTEDIPTGQMLSFTGGYDKSEIYSRFYGGVKGSIARNYTSFGYIFTSLEVGSFYNKTNWEEGVVSTQMLYFTEALPVGQWKIRQFIWNRFSLGYRRKPDQHISIDRDNGIRGFGIDLKGTQKLVTNYEVDFFAPYNLLGFRTVGVLFADFGLIGTQESSIFESRLYQGYGLGLRLRNEHLIFNTVQISFAFYPQANFVNKNRYDYYYTERPYYRFQDFGFSQPYILPF
jgi:hypothetical protein